MAELKPCPFCGGEAKMANTDIGGWQVYCKDCPCDYGRYWFATKKKAIEAWNRRAGEHNG